MAKERTINELRQTKEYYTGNTSHKDAQEIENLNNNYFQWTNKANNSEEMKKNRESMKECPLDPVEEAKILIVDKITRHFQDVMFEMVCEEMSDNYLFQSSNYLTEAGYDMFEDEWFEFYHEHHGDILYEVMKNITN